MHACLLIELCLLCWERFDNFISTNLGKFGGEKGGDIMKRFEISTILLLCILILFFIAGCDKVQQVFYLYRGNSYSEKGDYDKAIS